MRKIYRILGFIVVGVIFMACEGNAKNGTTTNIIDDKNETNETVVIDDKNETNGTIVIDDKNITNEIDVDDIQPMFLTLSPINNSKGISIITNLIIKLNENIIKGTGDILIKRSSDNSIVERVDVAGNLVNVTKATVTINPTKTLDFDTEYYIEIPSTALYDTASNPFTGITNRSSWSFRTVSNQSVIITGLTATQTINDNEVIQPFSSVTIEDKDSDTLSAIITMDDKTKGTLSLSNISSNTIANIEESLRALTFTPTSNHKVVGATETTTLTIIINDKVHNTTINTVIVTKSVNDAPTDITLSANYINQSAGTDATIGTLISIDVDMNETFIYSLVSGKQDTNNTSFNISGDLLKTDDSTLLNAGTYSIRVNTHDGDSNFSKEFNITVIDDSTLEKIAIDVKCTTPPTIDEYTELLKGDAIVKSEDNTTVSIYHDENRKKKVCLDYGEAYIERDR